MLPSNTSPESLPDKFNDLFVHKIEEIKSSFKPDRPIPTKPVDVLWHSLCQSLHLVTEDSKTSSPGNGSKSRLTSVLYVCFDKIIPIVTSVINKFLSSGIVPQCFKHALVKPLLRRPVLIQTA